MVRDADAKNRRLAAIVFTDIVGFSALVNRDETLGARALDLQRRIVRRLVPAFGGREIETAGDSFLLEFASAFAALRCVVAIQQTLAAEAPQAPTDAPLRLRASLHLGDIEHRGREVFGDGVNIAARLLPMAPEGGIAMSDQVHAQIRHRLDVVAQSLGVRELKNIRYPVEVLVFDAEAVAAIPPEVAGAGQGEQRAMRRREALQWLPMIAVALSVFAIGMVALRLLLPHFAVTEAMPGQRIAVLPFASFSSGPDDEMLAAGLQDSILTNLARLDALRVISRTSVLPYKNPGTRKIGEIAKELGADSILEGSLQRNGNRLLVQVQLIDAATDHHLWAQSYDRHVDDLFSVQSAIARDVAQAVKVSFTAPQDLAVGLQPTISVEAYAQYQRALLAIEARKPALEVQAPLDRALALDPSFALAHVLQARMHVARFHNNDDRSEARLALARQSLIKAAELRPDLPELHRGWGNFYAEGRFDLEAAIAEYETAFRLLPNDVETLDALGRAYQQRDRLPEALLLLRRAAELAPRSIPAQLGIVSTLELMRRYPMAERVIDRIESIDPASEVVPIYRARLALAQGDLARVRKLMTAIEYPPALETLTYYLGELEQSARITESQQAWQDTGTGAASYPGLSRMAGLRWMQGRHDEARRLFRQAIERLAPVVARPDPAPWDQQTSLAAAYAATGDGDAARKLIELVERDCCPNPVYRSDILSSIAFVRLLLGDRPGAIAAIDRLLRESSFLSSHFVVADPLYRSLRGDPAFEAALDRARIREREAADPGVRTAAAP